MNLRLPDMSRWNRDTRLLLVAMGVFSLSFLGVEVLLKVLYVIRLGYGPEYVGLFNAIGALTYMAMSVPASALGTRFGLRQVMILGGIVSILGMALMPLAEYVPLALRDVWPLATQMLITAGWCLFNINTVPALSAATTVETRSSAFALSGTLRGMGTFFGTTVGGLLPSLFGAVLNQSLDLPGPYRLGLWVGALGGLGALIPIMRLGQFERYIPKKAVKQQRGPFPIKALAPLLAHVVLSHGGWATCHAFCSAYMDTDLRLAPASIGLITGVGQFAGMLAPLLIPRLGKRLSFSWVMMICSLGMAVTLAPMALIAHWAPAGFGRFGNIVLSAMWLPAMQVFQMERVEPAWRTLAYGVASMAMGFSFGMVSLGGGYLIAALGYRALFMLGIGMSALGGVLMLAMMRNDRRSAAPLVEAAE